jgi:predicted permease
MALSDLAHDMRTAWRALRQSPGFVLAAVLSVALGIGANTALFSVADALLLHPLPYRDAHRLVILWNRSPGLGIAEDWFSTAQYIDIQTAQTGFDALAIAIGSNMNLTGNGDPLRIGVIRASSSLLPMLGVRPAAGRLFGPDEDVPGHAGSAILSDGLWSRRFGRDPAIVGRSIVLNGQPFQVVGVLPPQFSLPREVLPTLGVAEDGDVFLPLPLGAAAATTRGHEDYNIVGHLAAGVTVQQIQGRLDALTSRLRHDHPDVYPPNGGLTFSAVPLLEQVVGHVRRPLLMLVGAVALVLLIACANVAHLLLARAIDRQRETAVRLALGASRGRLIQQWLAESLSLTLAGGAVGAAGAAAAVRAIQIAHPPDIPRLAEIAVNGEVLAVTFLAALIAGVVVGLAPLAGAGRINVNATLKDAGRGSGSDAIWSRRGHLRRLMVMAELALSVVLLVGAALLLRSFDQLQRVSPGFDASGVLTLELTMTGPKYADGKAVFAAYRELWSRLDQLPGVVASGGVTALPLSNFFSWGPITVDGRVPPPGEAFLNADQRIVSDRYFEAMRVPLLRGRLFDARDTADQPRVIVVDERMAGEIWPGVDPIGRRIRFGDSGSTSPWATVIGVVARVKQYALDADDRIALYLTHAQVPSRALYVVVRTGNRAETIAPAVADTVHGLDADLPLYHVRTMADRVAQSMARQRFALTGLALFAVLALALASIGVYGVMAYFVSHGSRDLGIRLALGASPAGIVQLVMRQGLTIAAVGLGAGLLAAALVTRLFRSLVYGVSVGDPIAFVAAAAVLGLTAAIACYVPARRAGRVDPLTSLRRE